MIYVKKDKAVKIVRLSLFLLLPILLLTLVSCSSETDELSARVMSLFRVVGDEINVTRGTVQMANAQVGISLHEGHSLITGLASNAYVQLDTASLVKMDEDSAIEIETVTDRLLSILVQSGQIFVGVNDQAPGHQLNTRVGNVVLGVRGTMFVAGYNENGLINIIMLEGSGEVGDIILAAGQILIADYDEIIEVRYFEYDELNDFTLQVIRDNISQMPNQDEIYAILNESDESFIYENEDESHNLPPYTLPNYIADLFRQLAEALHDFNYETAYELATNQQLVSFVVDVTYGLDSLNFPRLYNVVVAPPRFTENNDLPNMINAHYFEVTDLQNFRVVSIHEFAAGSGNNTHRTGHGVMSRHVANGQFNGPMSSFADHIGWLGSIPLISTGHGYYVNGYWHGYFPSIATDENGTRIWTMAFDMGNWIYTIDADGSITPYTATGWQIINYSADVELRIITTPDWNVELD